MILNTRSTKINENFLVLILPLAAFNKAEINEVKGKKIAINPPEIITIYNDSADANTSTSIVGQEYMEP